MKILSIALILLMPSIALSDPWLTCDVPNPDEQVTNYTIYKDSVELATVAAEPDGSLRYDLAMTTPAAYTWTATASNIWGASSPSNPYISPSPSSAPIGLRVIIEP